MKYRLLASDEGFRIVNDSQVYSTGFEIVNLINRLDKKCEYQLRVINKAIKFERNQEERINELLGENSDLKQENGILRKIISELNSRK